MTPLGPERPLAAIGAITLVATGCAPEPVTAADVVSRAPPTSEAVHLTLPSRDELIALWQLPPGDPWAPYEKFTLPTALDQAQVPGELPDVGALQEVYAARCAAAHAAEAGLPPGTMWVVDLRGAAAVAFGSELSLRARQSLAIVPTFNNWPAEGELVPAEETLAAMIAMPPRAPAPGPQASVPVLLLDAWRLAYKDQEIDESVVDNRYMLSEGDLPSAEVLRSQSIGRVVYLVEDRASVAWEEDDLNGVFLSYKEAGIEIDIVDVPWLCDDRVAAQPTWWPLLSSCPLSVLPRCTVVEDECFYARARGGFGGIHARPFAIGHPYVGGPAGGHAFGGGHLGGHSFGGGIGGG
jgi:hypothetical protein